MNNHFSSKAVVNAAVLKSLVGQPVTGTYPPEMVERYPELNGLVRGRAVYGFTYIFSITSPTRIFAGTSNPLDQLAEHHVLAVERRTGVEHDVELRVGLGRRFRDAPSPPRP